MKQECLFFKKLKRDSFKKTITSNLYLTFIFFSCVGKYAIPILGNKFRLKKCKI